MTLLNGPVKSVTMVTPELAKAVADFLIDQSAWFEVMPLLDNELRITFKEENKRKVLDFIGSL